MSDNTETSISPRHQWEADRIESLLRPETAYRLRELIHWSGSKCDSFKDCPGVDDCCYAESLPSQDVIESALQRFAYEVTP